MTNETTKCWRVRADGTKFQDTYYFGQQVSVKRGPGEYQIGVVLAELWGETCPDSGKVRVAFMDGEDSLVDRTSVNEG